MSPLLSIVWLTGLVWVLYVRGTRFLGIAYLALIAIMWALDAKSYYPAPVYPYLIAAGAVPFETWSAAQRGWRAITVAAMVIFALPSIPFVLPVLPLRTFVAYQESLGRLFDMRFHVDRNAGNGVPIEHFADMTGWPELAGTIASVYGSLPAAERAQAAIFTHNAGEAAAVDVFGKSYGLPPALSGNDNYWIWGPRGFSGNVLIDVNGNLKDDRTRFHSVKLAAIFHNPYAMPYENNVRIYICRGILEPLAALWPRLRDYSYGLEEL